MLLIPFEEMKATLKKILEKKGFSENKADLIAKTLSESTLDGYHSHGINRFVLLLNLIKKGVIAIEKEAKNIFSLGAFERWDGQQGPGIINAHICMSRCIELAKNHGMACVALQNNNHWFRGGTYGWQAANQNCMAICFTNTKANIPPWGSKEPRTGNNPLIIAVPHPEGHVVLDISMSQFSYGRMSTYAMEGKDMPYPAGHNKADQLTTDPKEIIETERALPIGYWKGSGLSMMLDLLATTLSAGLSTAEISKKGDETGLSQVFICWDIDKTGNTHYKDMVQGIVENYCSAQPIEEGEKVPFPGQQTLERRKKHLQEGIPVNEKVWKEILEQ